MATMSDSPPAQQFLKKLRTISSPTNTSPSIHSSGRQRLTLILSVLIFQIILLLSARSLSARRRPNVTITTAAADSQCEHGKVYVYDLPSKFNTDLLAACDAHDIWYSRCAALSGTGFGPHATDLTGTVPSSLLSAWHSTNQFAAEIIYHRRLLSHPCRTTFPSSAAAFYVPFYAGLAVARHLLSPNSTSLDRDRDRDSSALLQWLARQTPYRRSGGGDHFTVLGSITWDFRCSHDDDWGSGFLYMPEMSNVTRLLIERDPGDARDIAVPYPTGFHPRTAGEVRAWQRFVLDRPRRALFTFAAGPLSEFKDDFRGLLKNECTAAGAAVCTAVDCSGEGCEGNRSVGAVKAFLGSRFCLQPRGDSFTRRSMFDCMVAGSIPVLFWRRSAYLQYDWYLPVGGAEDEGEWSVFVNRTAVKSGEVSVRAVLEGIGEERVRRMRERVVGMIPTLVYAASETGMGDGVRDAVDIAVDGVLRRFQDERRRLKEAEVVERVA